MAVATAFLITGARFAGAQDIMGVSSDKAAAIVVYPKVKVDSSAGVNTVIRLANTNTNNPILAHCFYNDANSHCSGGPNDGQVCTDDPSVCTGLSFCVPGWQETDFRVLLTPGQPVEWLASSGMADSQLPLPTGVCVNNPSRRCGTDLDCSPFPGGRCTFSNAGTRVPPVPEDPFTGELRCIAIDQTGAPISRNDLKGEGLTVISTPTTLDVASYNAVGIQATGSGNNDGVLVLGPGGSGEYHGCPNYLILDHFFDAARNPVPGTNATLRTNLVLVPCSTDYLRQIPGLAVIQYLVFNEFEQRFSTSRSVRCFQDMQLSLIDTFNENRSIWNVATAGTLTGQTRINPIGVGSSNPPSVPSGMLGIAVERHAVNGSSPVKSAAFNLQMVGSRDQPDIITIP
jgi:hypothetical protein